jgi:hypothetical protein
MNQFTSLKHIIVPKQLLYVAAFVMKQEFVTELPTSSASGKFYMKHKIVLFQKIEV